MSGYITLKRPRILGAVLHIHWSAFVVAGVMFGAMIRQPLQAILMVLSYYGVILLHETGHALFAKRRGYRPIHIYLAFIHGLCEYESPDTLKESAIIAWGGVLTQLAVAIPLIVLTQTTQLASNAHTGIVIAFFGYFSLFNALLNLLPVRGLDGFLAWRLIPIIFREARQKHAAKKTTREIIRRVK
jgi:Zn-dependent protease